MKNLNSILAWLAVAVITAFLFYQAKNSNHGQDSRHQESNHSSNHKIEVAGNELKGSF
ncbi:MAG: hypothetical protein ACEQSF_03080 [Solirubrobacteraceae bacterium]